MATVDAVPQHMQALEVANRVRLARADLKHRVAAGEVSAADVVREVPWEAETMTIFELLTVQRRWGKTRARRFLGALQPAYGMVVGETKRLGMMTDRQRRIIVAALMVGNAERESPAAGIEGALEV